MDGSRRPDIAQEFAQQSDIALGISRGVEVSSIVNPNFVGGARKRRELSLEDYFQGIRSGDRMILARAITLIESSLPRHQEVAQELIHRSLPYTGSSIRLGITGVPGAGKSTFIESFGLRLHDHFQRKIAVLAIDPSSQVSGGSILGDKTRMAELSGRPNVFIRPSPSGCSLGGVTQKTRESVLLCEAAGFDTIFIETVGVGQSETAVHGMVDFFLLLMLAGAGDGLQGIKRGIMEMADGIAITKADGSNLHKAQLARVEYQNALHLFPPNPWKWAPRVISTSALERQGMDEVWQMVLDFAEQLRQGRFWDQRRKEQVRGWMQESIHQGLLQDFQDNPAVRAEYSDLEREVVLGHVSPFLAAKKLVEIYRAR
ncbi:MAG TPA: methylmalonyl Co-A mutase-associated GTPase MeaB [Fibrobacteraceae bacterium]|nr:methylmalonyl Co-A mutase-associated GTPase MeaB [Fibrobacteraceae bacterium]